MRRSRPRQDYSRKLSRRITLADRTRLETLKDAADLFTGERFASLTVWPALEDAIGLVIEAGERGGRERIRAATNQIEVHTASAPPAVIARGSNGGVR